MLLSRRRVCPLFLIVFRGLRSRLRGQQSRRWRSLSSGRSPHASAAVAASSGDAERAVWRARISASRGARSSSRRRFAKPR